MRITAINTVHYQNSRISRSNQINNQQTTIQQNISRQPAFKSDAGALKGMAIGVGVGLLAAAAIVATGGAAALGVPALGIFGASAGAGAQVGGIAGGLTTGKE